MNPVEVFLGTLQSSLGDGSFRKLTLGKLRGELDGQEHVYLRLVEIQGGLHLSFLHRFPDKDITKNLPLTDALAAVRGWVGTASLAATLFTDVERRQLLFNRRGKPRMTHHAEQREAVPLPHDQPKARALRDERFLQPLGVLDPAGRPSPQMGDKYRQIHHFIELVAPLVREFRSGNLVRVVDLACGKGYLTFALYQYLVEQGLEVDVRGVEKRRPLVELANGIARDCGFSGLHFDAQDIEQTEVTGADLVVALHACDTATDDALRKGVQAGARWLLAAPCCHQEVRPQIQAPPGLEPLFRFGIEVDRLAESVTDAIRALCLEASGYQTRIQEFISLEHTHKNRLIMAAKQLKATDQVQKWREVEAFQAHFGIKHQSLSAALKPGAPEALT
ncbi:MAG TPA: SAM-dependent methyltransferase [Chthoniobacterales bacterium]